MLIIDAEDMIVGRLASHAAKQALLGKEVRIVNSEKAIISGKKQNTYKKYLDKKQMGTPRKGPFVHRRPERLMRRAIRGMIPYKTPRGREAYKRILCYTGVPEEFKDKKFEKVDGASRSKLPNLRYTTLKKVSRAMGARVE